MSGLQTAEHDINAYVALLRVDGNLTLVGAPPKPLAISAFALILGRRSVSGSPIGGIAETQEMPSRSCRGDAGFARCRAA